MKYKIKKRIRTAEGEKVEFRVNGKQIVIVFTGHSLLRVLRWGLKISKVITALLNPDEVVTGHSGRFIAHKIYGKHIVRAIYERRKNISYLITVYYPFAKRYFQGGGKFADKIFS